MTRTTRYALTSALIAGLLLGGIGLARGHGGLAGPAAVRVGSALPMIAGLPIGTAIEAAFYDADPASGAAPVTTLAITVGVDSEAAFADAFSEARAAAAEWEAAYLVVATSEIRRTIDLPDGDDAITASRPWGATLLRLAQAGLGEGDTVTVELYDADPEDGGNLLDTLAFAYGIDSAIGFRAAVEEALESAAVAVVTSSPRSVTVDLKVVAERVHGMAERMGPMAARLGGAAERWEDAPMAPGMRGRR